MENNNPLLAASAAAPVRAGFSAFDATVKSVNATWSLLKIVVVVSVVMWAFGLKNSGVDESQLGMSKFITLASPLETTNQSFSIGNYKMPKIAVLAALPESERVANPSLTAAQLQRAKWMDRTWNDVRLRNESNRALSNASKGFVSEEVMPFVNDAMGRKSEKSDVEISELVSVNVLVGAEIIPSLASGLLPVFSDAETAAWKNELARGKVVLNELDMRRAKFFQTKFGPGSMPEKAQSDIEIRAEEKLAHDAQPVDYFGRRASIATAPLSNNERLEAACNALNIVANPALIPVTAPVARR